MNKYFRNAYKCSCGEIWEDEWDSICDDRCPKCNKAIGPHASVETGLCLALWASIDMYEDRRQETSSYGDEDTPEHCEQWADECSIIFEAYPDFFAADQLKELADDFRRKAAELRAESYGA